MRNEQRIILIIFGILLLCVSCPKQDDGGASTTGTTPITTPPDSHSATSGDTAADPATGDQPGSTDDPGEATDGTSAELPEGLTGQWFALFGRHDMGILEQSWDNGHRIEFRADGTGTITKFVNGAQDGMMSIKWQQEGDRIILRYTPAEAVSTGLSGLAPMGLAQEEEIGLLGSDEDSSIGRDEEIGLLDTDSSIGRDEEIGLLEGGNGGSAETRDSVGKKLDVILEDNYLALTDQHARLMVYGRVYNDESATNIPDLSGTWVGHIDMHDNFPATFTITGNKLTATYDHDGGTFRGAFNHGYFIGKIFDGPKVAMAALRLAEGYELDGAYCPDPFHEMISRYDFNRVSE